MRPALQGSDRLRVNEQADLGAVMPFALNGSLFPEPSGRNSNGVSADIESCGVVHLGQPG
jgi:hypothetical protein